MFFKILFLLLYSETIKFKKMNLTIELFNHLQNVGFEHHLSFLDGTGSGTGSSGAADAGIEAIGTMLNEPKQAIETAVKALKDIIKYLCYGAALILVVVMILAETRGKSIGFNAGQWALVCGIAAIAIEVASKIFAV
ncbi:MAG: hypothetical protein ACK5MD_10590 [Flavobacteriales bacterium]